MIIAMKKNPERQVELEENNLDEDLVDPFFANEE